MDLLMAAQGRAATTRAAINRVHRRRALARVCFGEHFIFETKRRAAWRAADENATTPDGLVEGRPKAAAQNARGYHACGHQQGPQALRSRARLFRRKFERRRE